MQMRSLLTLSTLAALICMPAFGNSGVNSDRAWVQARRHLDKAFESKDWKYIPTLAESARSGDAKAQYELAIAYAAGKPVERNPVSAMKWMRAAAEAGNLDAAYSLGTILSASPATPSQMEEAVKWWRKGSEKGHSGAQERLGSAYRRGEGVAQNLQEAQRLFMAAADQGEIGGYLGLASMLAVGDGVPKDEAQALVWLRRAGDAGSQIAQNKLGDVYLKGELGVHPNIQEGLRWWEKSAAQGNRDAIARLAGIYRIGEEAPEDNKRALFFSLLSQRMGFKGAEAFIQAIEHNLSSAEVAQVRQDISSWTPKPVE